MLIGLKRAKKKILLRKLFILVLWISGTGTVLAETAGPLSWEPASFGTPASFKLGEQQSGAIFGDDGISQEFKKILASNPAALAEAERTQSAAITVTAGWVLLLAGATLELKATMDQADDPLAESESGKGLGLVIAGAVVALVGTSIFKSHLNSSVQIYNEGIKQGSRSSRARVAQSLQFGFELGRDSAANQLKAGDVALVGSVKFNF